MQAALFDSVQGNDYLDFSYVGSSFNHQIDIDKLSKELEGANRALRKVIAVSARYNKLELSSKDIAIFVEPFAKGSFKKRVRIIAKHLKKNKDEYGVLINAGLLIVGILTLIKLYSPTEISTMSPQLQAEIGDIVKVELLKDKDFIRDLAAFSIPLTNSDDKLVLTHPSSTEVEIDINDKKKLESITKLEEDVAEYKVEQNLVGRVTRVDLDATVNHIGFKVDDKGATINCTFLSDLSQDSKRNLLGAWVRLEGLVTYKGKEPIKIDITEINEAIPPKQGVLLPKE